ncbi:MAG: DUF58 domain-containing protein [Sulfurovum sp.]|nr:DUF58 domain-containing protein [Sulfurovum sp.]
MKNALKVLQLKARHQVYTSLSGHNLSLLHGEGYDFSALREYQIGDDIRKIHWIISAKQSKPYIKELHVSRELSVVVAALMDGNLYFAKGNDKQKKIAEIAAILGYTCEEQGDLFSGFCYAQEKNTYTPPTKQLYSIEKFVKTLFETTLLHTSIDYQASVKNLFNRIHKPSLLFILSDFLEDIDLSYLAQKHELIAIVVRDKEEDSPKQLGEVTLTSPKYSGVTETYFGKHSKAKYLDNLQAHDLKLLKHFAKHNIRHIKIRTDDNVISKLLLLFT